MYLNATLHIRYKPLNPKLTSLLKTDTDLQTQLPNARSGGSKIETYIKKKINRKIIEIRVPEFHQNVIL